MKAMNLRMLGICKYDEYNCLDAVKFERVCGELANFVNLGRAARRKYSLPI